MPLPKFKEREMAQYIAVGRIKNRKAEGGFIKPGEPVEIPDDQAEELIAKGVIRKATGKDKVKKWKKG